MINQMEFKTLDMILFQSMIKGAVIYGLTFEASEDNGVYTIAYTGGF
jgi:hypothetical protein